jgi:predicted outer membrane repeat protein
MGGAILAEQWSTVAAFGLVENNSAGGHGGGIASVGQAYLAFGTGIAMRGNRAGGSGGCVYTAGANTSFGEHKFW